MGSECVDLLVIGAGPAGLGAALQARQCGLSVRVLDEQAHPGGQIYRNVSRATAHSRYALGASYRAGASLVEQFLACGADYSPGSAVWQISPPGPDDSNWRVHYLNDELAHVAQGRRLLIASGALERPMPIPGWTLPGVMTAGAGQILLKNAGVAPSTPVVLAGCGPLLYLLAVQYLRAGVSIAALVDTSGPADLWRHRALLKGALPGWRELLKGLGLLLRLKLARLPHYRNARHLKVEGEGQASSLSFQCAGHDQRVEARLILLHQGVVPDTQISRSLRLEHTWHDGQSCWASQRDPWGETSLAGCFIAGDGGAIVGAMAAKLQGRLAALACAQQLERIDSARLQRDAQPLQQRLARALAPRALLDSVYQPLVENSIPADDVIICRCEEVSAGTLRQAVANGCLGPNQAKAFSRCGMGPCQGRQCGLTVTQVIAAQRGVSPAEVGAYRIRPPLKPITFGQLASEQA